MRIVIAILSTVFFTHVSGYAQQSNNGYYNELKKMYEKEQATFQDAIEKNKCWYLSYSMTSLVLNEMTGAYKNTVTNGEMLANRSYRFNKANGVEVFMDEKDVFTVNRSMNMIMRTKTPKNALAIKSAVYYNLFSDSLKRTMNVSSCKHYKGADGTNIVEYTAFPVDKAKSPFLMLSYCFDDDTKALRKVQVEYNTAVSNSMKSFTMTVNQRIDRNDVPELPLKNKFLNTNGRLKPPYQTFSYKDLHNKP
ncbi:MAG: hypothetical protein JST82_14000 [Bacteroidetes bacterium]|nr:hypothetical protein [Bacteroidota bacterium]